MAPVVLHVRVHCYRCEREIRKAIRGLRGVGSVSVSPESGLVVVHGTVDAEALRRRIQRKTGRSVIVLSDGWGSTTSLAAPHYAGMTHLAPSPPHYYGAAHAPAPYDYDPYHYSQPPTAYAVPYGGAGDHWAEPDDPYHHHHHVSDGTPSCSIL